MGGAVHWQYALGALSSPRRARPGPGPHGMARVLTPPG